jgi:hypothetical protein
MLGKLLKYEVKATARLFLPLYLTILIFAALNRFFFAMPNIGERSFSFSSLAMTISMVVYVTLIIGMVLMTFIVLVQRFYKNLLGDEGYLMFTLPVQSWSHILSKLTVSMLWTVVSSGVALCSILLISANNISTPQLYKGIIMVINQFRHYFGASAYLVSFEAIVLGLLAIASTILTIYAAIALGHLFNKHKLLASFGMYIALKTVSQIFMTLFGSMFWNQASFRMEIHSMPSALQVNNFLLVSILYFGAITAGYFVLTNYILKRKLNLE